MAATSSRWLGATLICAVGLRRSLEREFCIHRSDTWNYPDRYDGIRLGAVFIPSTPMMVPLGLP